RDSQTGLLLPTAKVVILWDSVHFALDTVLNCRPSTIVPQCVDSNGSAQTNLVLHASEADLSTLNTQDSSPSIGFWEKELYLDISLVLRSLINNFAPPDDPILRVYYINCLSQLVVHASPTDEANAFVPELLKQVNSYDVFF
ncbi:unnamed protein product, partial [Protopolystoma xenopodis]